MALADRAGLLGSLSGAVVSAFLPIRTEIDLRPLMAALAGQGARLCLPAILDRETIVFRDLVRGAPLV
ncbi:MAG: 5-formyltetrahydrofolate cyclo-ligase, partial [Rhizobiaceae bacterium]